MTPPPPATALSGLIPHLVPFYGALFLALGAYMPLLPVWLEAKGLDAEAIGLVLAAPILTRIIVVPLAARIADRRAALRGALIATTFATATGYAALGFADGFLVIFAVAAMAATAFTPVFPLSDAYALKGLARIGRAYGPVRMWGSATFIAGNLAAGFLLDLMSARDLIWVIVSLFFVAAFTSVLLLPLPVAPATHAEPAAAARLFWRTPAFLAVAAASSVIQASHALYYGFSTIAWTGIGLDGREIGALWALGVVSEMVLFAVSGRLPPAITPTLLLCIGAAGAVVRWGLMAMDPPAAMLPLLQCLHAISFGATHLGTMQFLLRAAPEHLTATAQGYLAVALGVSMSASMGLAGWLFGAYGSVAYGAMAMAGLIGGVLALIAHRLWRGERLEPDRS